MGTRAARFGASEAEWRDWRWQHRQAIPTAAELDRAPGDLRDPLGEDVRRPVRAIVHRYPDRALLLATDRCAVYCRHCTRRRVTFEGDGALSRSDLGDAVAYLRAHPGIRDVIVSGGDPLVLGDDRIEELLAAVRSVPHVKIVRLATLAPVVCPMRIDADLARLLRRHAPLFVVTHFNHPKECTDEARVACETLVDAGVPVENQTVLLRGVNSSARILKDLFERLLEWRVRPYYLHQGDLAEGTGHLRTPLEAGVAILEALRGRTSGLAVPHLAVDLPGGGGKVTVQPEYRLDRAGGGEACGRHPGDHDPLQHAERRGTWFRSYRGERYFYPDPAETDCSCPYDEVFYAGAGKRPG